MLVGAFQRARGPAPRVVAVAETGARAASRVHPTIPTRAVRHVVYSCTCVLVPSPSRGDHYASAGVLVRVLIFTSIDSA